MRIKTLNKISTYENVYIYGDFNFTNSAFKYFKMTPFRDIINTIVLDEDFALKMPDSLIVKYNITTINKVINNANSVFICTRYTINKLLSINKNLNFLLFNEAVLDNFFIDKAYDAQMHIIDECNLNCRGCNHFSPLASKGTMKNLDDFERDMKLFKNSFGEECLREFYILGGEPLLHPKVNDFMRIARKYIKNTKIMLITNGLLLPNMPETFFDTCKKYNIEINITDYPIQFDYESCYDMLREKNVKFSMGHYSDKNNVSIIDNTSLDKYNPRNIYKSLKDCSVNCLTINNSRMYKCPIAAYYKYFNQYFGEHLDEGVENGILLEGKTMYEVLDKLNEPCSFCKYCHPVVQEKWEISKCDIAEWATPEYASKYNQLNKQ